MLRNPNSILRIKDVADIVQPATITFELYNAASNSDRVASMYARSRIRYDLDKVAEFKYSRRKELNRGRKGCRGCENKLNGVLK